MTRPSAAVGGTYRSQLAFSNVLWLNVLAIGTLHVLCVFAPMTFSWSALALMFALSWLCGGLGICLGYHRLLTHRSFKTPAWMEYTLALLGCMNWQGGPVHWVGIHRIHHNESDQPDDPHSPQHGFTWAHILWCMIREPDGCDPRNAARDLRRDPIHAFIDDWYWVPQFALAGLLYLLGGWSWVIWGVCVRTVFVYHATWFVNSASHTWGYRNYETTDGSKNLWWVALLSFGEGWHNNHHAFQRSAAHGLRWWEFDPTHWTIRLMQLVGLARDVVTPGEESLRKAA